MTEIKIEETCSKCLGAGKVPGKRGNHPSINNEKHCWRCNGSGETEIAPIFSTKIIQGNNLITIEGQAHTRKTVDELVMETESFYKKYRGKKDLPSLPHIEVEILNYQSKFFSSTLAGSKLKLHVHPVNEKHFMCWTGDLNTLEEAKKAWEKWCLGSVWSWFRFNQGDDSYDFEQILGDKFEPAMKEADIMLAPVTLKLN